jgi:hypothetical protein
MSGRWLGVAFCVGFLASETRVFSRVASAINESAWMNMTMRRTISIDLTIVAVLMLLLATLLLIVWPLCRIAKDELMTSQKENCFSGRVRLSAGEQLARRGSF